MNLILFYKKNGKEATVIDLLKGDGHMLAEIIDKECQFIDTCYNGR